MATAYAAFTSLMHLISDLRQHPYPPIKLDEEHFNSLGSIISFFQRFLEDRHTSIDLQMELKIADAAYAAEDVIDSHIADEDFNHADDFNASLQKAIQGMDLIMKEVTKMNLNTEKRSQVSNQPKILRPADHAGDENNVVVGMEDLTMEIVDKLTLLQHGSGYKIITITGMGGIGKTTLARKVYDQKCTNDYFDVRAWATISKDYNIRESLVELLRCLKRRESKETLRGKGEQELGVELYQFLSGRRYLVIVDDLWDIEAWDRLRSFFPNSRGSGIVITTRQSRFASISSHSFHVDLLDKRQTWDLFCKIIFGKDDSPPELWDVGKKISDNCRGLPLSVVVVGGHLAKSQRTREYWESVAENLCPIVNSEDDGRCLKILYLSYIHLPVHLKPCFLYMGIFPEDEEIDVDKLIRLWVAEGFIKPIYGRSLEEAAQDYIDDLIGRNLVLVARSSRSGEVVNCKVHDLLRDLCLKEALEKKFFCIVRKQDQQVSNKERRIILYPNSYKTGHRNITVQKSHSVTRTLILHDTLLPSSVVYKSLRVLASAGSLDISLNNMGEVASQLANLRCPSFPYKWNELCSSIFSLWNLQYLDIEGFQGTEAPQELWRMSQLRHIRITDDFSLSDPPSESHVGILKNLQSAENILNCNFSEDMVERIPNVRRLFVLYDDRFNENANALNNVARLEKLEKFVFFLKVGSLTRRNEMSSSLTFPLSLKELSVGGLRLDDVSTKIGSLPLLEELNLYECSGSEWEHVEGQFVRLRYLNLYDCSDLERFTPYSSHFPCLEELILVVMDSLEEISSDIGDIETLRLIQLDYCHDSAVLCAKEIGDYQKHQMGNDELHVMVRLLPKSYIRSSKSLSASSNFTFE